MNAFQQTLAVVLAHAAAGAEPTSRQSEHFRFRLLAASDRDTPALPEQGWTDLSRLLQLRPERAEHNLRLRVQARGFAALQQVAGRQARLTSGDGLLNQSFGFDAAGGGVLVFADTPEVRRALADCRVLLEPRGAV